MVGKRVIKVKRPAVLCAAAFVTGVALERCFGRISADDSGSMIVGAAVLLLALYVWYLRKLQKGRRRVSVMDKLLVLTPVFLLFGYLVMNRAIGLYERDVAAFAECRSDGKEVLAEGVVSHIRLTANGVRVELKDASAAAYEGEETLYRPVGKLLVYTDDIVAENGEIKHGQRVFVYGNGSLFENASNPGCFDAKAYYFSLGITGAVHAKAVRITEASYHRLNQALFQAKNTLLNSYVTYLGEEGAGVISSMLLGERAFLSDETEELYRRGGISHILAISGLHVSMIGMALYEFLRKTVLGRNGAIPVSCAGVILYGTFVEAGTSTKRAVIMFILLLLATVLGRTYDTLSAMSISVIVILCQSPGALYTASFQLSFAAAYGASVLAAVLRDKREEQDAITEARKVAGRAGSKRRKLWEYFS
jgi:competence protein ComEC